MRGDARAGAGCPLCARLSLTSWGSDFAASLERAALRAARGVPVVDAHAITKRRCNDTKDGRHYTPRLPAMLAAFARAVAPCPPT